MDAFGFGVCGTTHAQWSAEMDCLQDHGRGRDVRVLQGQGLDPGGLALAEGLALELGLGLATVVGLTLRDCWAPAAEEGLRRVVGVAMGEPRERR